MNYYNENDPFCAEWLRNLILRGLIPPGDVDDRSIVEVQPDDLKGYTQCHFFAGIGGWSRALELAGYSADRPVFTGSCPCQPFSVAGRGEQEQDERHLWPEFRRLIAECNPSVVFGEQVASRAGRRWLAGVRTDLEERGYAVGGANLPAACVAAPHERERLWWVALAVANGDAGQLADGEGDGRREGRAHAPRRKKGTRAQGTGGRPSDDSGSSRMGDADDARSQGHAGDVDDRDKPGRIDAESDGSASETGGGFWDDAIWIPCEHGKMRRIKPGLEPLAHGVRGRVGLIRAYGNAIVPQVGAKFVRACMEIME